MKTNTDNERLVRITDEISVFYEIDRKHYFLMRTSQFAKACNIRINVITLQFNRHKEKYIESKDFVIHNNVMKWTRQGIITLSYMLNKSRDIDIFQNWITKGFKKPVWIDEYIRLNDTEIVERGKLQSITLESNQLYNLLLEVQEITNPKLRKSILTKLLSYDTANKNK